MVKMVCDKCKREICRAIATEIRRPFTRLGQPWTYHLCQSCTNEFVAWCKEETPNGQV